MIDAIGWGLIGLGAVVMLITTAGLHRFDDAFARLHVAGSATTLGTVPTLIGAALIVGGGGAAKLLLTAFFLLMTTPAATKALGGAAASAGVRTAPNTVVVPVETDRVKDPR